MKFALPLFALLLAAPALAGAAQERPPIPDAEALIKACDAASDAKMNADAGTLGSHALMIEASEEIISCLKGHILENLTELSGPESARRASKELDDLEHSTLNFYSTVYVDIQACRPACGIMYELFPYGIMMYNLEDTLRRVIDQRKRYENW